MKKIKVGIVGLGRLGRKHAENIAFKIPNAELTAVCSVVKEEVEEIQKKWRIKYGYISYDEMLENKELDAIFISSPSGFHCEQIIKALEKGFHVFSEKPLGLYLEETEKVAKIVNKYKAKQVFMLGFMRRYDNSYEYVKKKIEEGIIGKPVFIRCYGLDPAKGMESFLKFAKDSYSGGLFLDMAIHDLDLARWYLKSEAKSVWAIGGAYEYPEFEEINDAETGAALVKFENGAIPEKNLVTIFDDNGAIRECSQGFLERFEQAYLSETEEFINCIIEKRQPDVTVEDGVNSTALAYACKKSFETGELVTLKE
ncbi:Gfo/Idh/MocA family oxidoreductase [Clostridium tetanomorphum]|uniref:Gfo/Idh/MocA family oxidoreductase n=1 Tax=Clostridium tetanomorphum TaxID=1553 RepID=A0A923J0U6_CLOTT|nr:Gfo/Idh/MocA family oxidoreductase [Clostridium tetanomorphum]MBC2397090.1 Gfo/Idh/MocA family oxidoreductase [Clostridium tetanomorphum]NRZ99066.1 myo-inositol 2-dehydrogenase/D-chiro-inositol 1-dehydrogenase [Clostridium tetanomorphum]